MQTTVGLFERYDDAQGAVQDLIDTGFNREQISMIGSDEEEALAPEQEKKVKEVSGTTALHGSVIGGSAGLLIGAGLLAIPGIGQVIAAGPIVAAIGGLLGVGVGAAAGGLLGALVSAGVPEEEAHYYAEGVRRGGTLVAVSADERMARTARNILQRRRAIDIQARGAEWRAGGWTGFDPGASPYRPEPQ